MPASVYIQFLKYFKNNYFLWLNYVLTGLWACVQNFGKYVDQFLIYEFHVILTQHWSLRRAIELTL